MVSTSAQVCGFVPMRGTAEQAEHHVTTSPSSFGRLSVGSAARTSGLLDPALRWADATLYDGGTIAYIAVQPHNDDTNELGVIAHGPNSEKLAAQFSDLLHRWVRERPSQLTITARPAGPPHAQTPSAAHIDRPHTQLTITW